MKMRAKPILKYTALNDRLFRYVCACSAGQGDGVLEALRTETAAWGTLRKCRLGRTKARF